MSYCQQCADLMRENAALRGIVELWKAHANTNSFVYYSDQSRRECQALIEKSKLALGEPVRTTGEVSSVEGPDTEDNVFDRYGSTLDYLKYDAPTKDATSEANDGAR